MASNPTAAPRAGRRRVVFTYYAPRAAEVQLMGDFNRWQPGAHPMRAEADGLWRKILYLPPGRYEYRFLVDGQWCGDPRNPLRCPNCYGSENSVVEVLPRQ